MASCKDCIHDKVCSEYFHAFWGHTANKHSDLINADPKDCPYFKDSSRFVELPPCKEGDSVYSICFCYGEGDTITEWTVVDIFLLSSKEEGNSIGIRLKDECIFINILPCELGNKYFLTKEAAKQALRERESNDNHNGRP